MKKAHLVTNQKKSSNQTLVSSVDKNSSWKGTVTSDTATINVKVNSLKGLFARGKQMERAKELA